MCTQVLGCTLEYVVYMCTMGNEVVLVYKFENVGIFLNEHERKWYLCCTCVHNLRCLLILFFGCVFLVAADYATDDGVWGGEGRGLESIEPVHMNNIHVYTIVMIFTYTQKCKLFNNIVIPIYSIANSFFIFYSNTLYIEKHLKHYYKLDHIFHWWGERILFKPTICIMSEISVHKRVCTYGH